MRSRFFHVLLGLVMGWTMAGVPAGASLWHKDRQEPDRTAPPYTTQRVVALQKGNSSCPPVSGWRGERLPDLVAPRVDPIRKDDDRPYGRYGSLSAAQVDKGRDKRSGKFAALLGKYGLDRFCVYTAKTPNLKFPPSQSVGLEKADPDRMALTPTAPAELGAIGDQTWPTLADHFMDQVGKVRLALATTPGIRLVFVDTHRTGEGPPASPVPTTSRPYPSWHGHAMANLGHEMVCGHDVPPANCAVHVATRLTLRYDKYERDMSFSPDPGSDGGGHLGLVGDLGVAILKELDNWQENYPGTKLILNLSVGWDGEYKDLDAKKVAELEASSQEVYKALRVAADLGVLVIASAGNRTGGEESTSPLLPAAWELKRPSWLPFSLCKLVYAVGGVDWQGLPLSNSRPGGRPWRVAYGDHAVARTSVPGGAGNPAESTKMYTGSSVSAAVVSSIAAVAWHLRPDLKPAQVMKLIGHAGEVLHDRADFYAWEPIPWLKPHMKRLSLCQAVLRICGPDERRCSPKLETLDCRLSKHSPADLMDIVPKAPDIVGFTPMASASTCDSMTQVFMRPPHSVSDPQESCPMEKLRDMATSSMVSTQPPENPCPACTAVPDPPRVSALGLAPDLFWGESAGSRQAYGLAVGLDPDWLKQANDHQTTLERAILVIDCRTGSPIKERFDVTALILPLFGPMPPAAVRLSFDKIDGRKSLGGCTASIDFKLKVVTPNGPEERSVQSPVYVDP